MVFVRFGYNTGKESSLAHPAVVVGHYDDLVVVVPLTGDDGGNLSKDLEKTVVRYPKDGKIMRKNGIAEIHQIRCISKNRITKDMNVNVQDYILPNTVVDTINGTFGSLGTFLNYGDNLLKAIEAKITYHYAPDILFELMRYRKEVEMLKQEKLNLEAKLKEITASLPRVAPTDEESMYGKETK
ncbi:type II toxin-antitoxin system PemK/MazF family toxin [Aneurinibacillus terranovensis]|uniref:type II toxin-antitoxin system PemK/MazF family toxin n=1 Tax=Aneurinibacillus terranovensis TaxID=278991 RepID=UPI000407B4A6|nr:type II toxin-antitoxin system PemK/MazF family toxin [Aneurinibacillus terranovensis]